MAFEKVSFGNCIIFALALAEVTSWTIDLPEVRKYVFERNEREKEKENIAELEEFIYKKDESDRPMYYSNVEGNSKHNSKYFDTYENTAYAREYGYESYMEKKVHDIVYNGSVYLEGLRRSLENFTTFLEICNRTINSTLTTSLNSTSWRPSIELSNSSFTSSETNGSTNSTTNGSTNSTTNGSTNSMQFLANSTFLARCREATNKSEHVRRLAELSMWAARELQDIAYARKYHKGDSTSLGMEENELILKLAWFLDRLAHYTGYEPQPQEFVRIEESTTTSTVAPTRPTLANASAEVTRQMMECLQSNTSGDGVERCTYPEPLPPVIQMMMEMNSNITGIPAIPIPLTDINDQGVPVSRSSRSENPLSDQTMELLVTADNQPPYFFNFPPTLADVRHIKKRSVLSMAKPEVEKSAGKLTNEGGLSENDPLIHFLKYYAKHKVWEGANLNQNVRKFQDFEVKNHIATHNIQKRAIDEKKFKHLLLPENPYQDLSMYAKHKPGVNYVKDEAVAKKIKSTLEKNGRKPSSSKKLLTKLTKLVRPKRSVTYEKDVDLPRESVDPQKDISYYSKNKKGRNYNNDLRQAAQVRAGLEQVFNTGNIEVVRRFGANYNPANPNPFLFGVLISQADF